MLLIAVCTVLGFVAFAKADRIGGVFAGFVIGAAIVAVIGTAYPKSLQCMSKAQGFQNVISLPKTCVK